MAPFCHACEWLYHAKVGRAQAKALVQGVLEKAGKWTVYQMPVSLCAMHEHLWNVDVGLQQEMSTIAGIEVAKNR